MAQDGGMLAFLKRILADGSDRGSFKARNWSPEQEPVDLLAGLDGVQEEPAAEKTTRQTILEPILNPLTGGLYGETLPGGRLSRQGLWPRGGLFGEPVATAAATTAASQATPPPPAEPSASGASEAAPAQVARQTLRWGIGRELNRVYNPEAGLSAEDVRDLRAAGFSPSTTGANVSQWTEAEPTPAMLEGKARDIQMKEMVTAEKDLGKRYKIPGIDAPLTRDEYLRLVPSIISAGAGSRRAALLDQKRQIEDALAAEQDPAKKAELVKLLTQADDAITAEGGFSRVNPLNIG